MQNDKRAEEKNTYDYENSAEICFDVIKAEYDFCVTCSERLETKINIFLTACAFAFVLLTNLIEKLGTIRIPTSVNELIGVTLYVVLLMSGVICYIVMLFKTIMLLKSIPYSRIDESSILIDGIIDEKKTAGIKYIGIMYARSIAKNMHILTKKYKEFNFCIYMFCINIVIMILLAFIINIIN